VASICRRALASKFWKISPTKNVPKSGFLFHARAMNLAFDIGTSSLRTAIYQPGGRRVEGTLVQTTYPLMTDETGRAEIEPAALERAARACLSGTLAAYDKLPAKEKKPIRAVGASCFWHSLIGLDTEGKPATKIITWADSRGRHEAARLRDLHKEADYHQHTGAMLRSSFWPAKLLWLRRTNPGAFDNVATWLSPADWLYSRLCASWHPGYSMASGTGLLDRAAKDWSRSWLKRCHLRVGQLGEISDEPVATSQSTARKFPALADALWYPPVGDGAANNLGCGATGPGVAAINFGTSAAIRIMTTGAAPAVPFGLFCYLVDRDHWLVGGAISNAGNVRAWALETLRLPEEAKLERELLRRFSKVSYLQVRPYLTAERAPDWPEDQPSRIEGMHPGTDAVEIFRALTDATYARLATIGNLLQSKVSGPFRKVVVSGGLLRSAYGVKKLQALLGCKLTPNEDPEGSLRGAALSTRRIKTPGKDT